MTNGLIDLPYHAGETLDDVMRWVFEKILKEGIAINPTKGPAREISGVLLEITNPVARLSRTETRGKPFSCLGELCWYLAKTNELTFIHYYLPDYRTFADGQEIFGAYGPRLFDWSGIDQFANVVGLLRKNPDSRKAVIQLFDARDILEDHNDIPCTCTLQFLIRKNQLHMFTHMRSNDAFLGMPHDIFCFTMLQEIVARILSVELGRYKHMVGSLHIYESRIDDAHQFLDEGWQPTETVMPPMPEGDPSPAIDDLLFAEQAIRTQQPFHSKSLARLDPYWADLVRLLLVFRASSKDGSTNRVLELRGEMSSPVYDQFINRRLGG